MTLKRELKSHVFIIRFRQETPESKDPKAQVHIDLEYVDERKRWHYSALDPALTCIREIIDTLQMDAAEDEGT